MGKKIPEEFKKFGYIFKLLERTDRVALYSQGKKDKVYAYEVHKVRTYKKPDKKYNISEGDERLSKTSEFGIYGWSYQEYVNAKRHYDELVEQNARR